MADRPRRALVSGPVALAFAGVLSSCGGNGPGPALTELRADPLSRYAPPGAALFRSREDSGAPGGGASKQKFARVLRVFVYPTATEAADAVSTIVSAASERRWTPNGTPSDTGALLERPCDQSTCTLSIALGPEAGQVAVELVRTV